MRNNLWTIRVSISAAKDCALLHINIPELGLVTEDGRRTSWREKQPKQQSGGDINSPPDYIFTSLSQVA